MSESKEYKVSDYGIFTNAITTVKALSEKMTQVQATMKEAEQTISDNSKFMGPIEENCMQALGEANNKVSSIITNLGTISTYLGETSTNYQAGDQAASQTVTSIGNSTSNNSASFISGGTMLAYQFNGKNFNIVNTRIPVADYQAYVQKNGINQNAGFLDGQCMILSQYYASDMISGKYTSKSNMRDKSGGPAVKMNERVRSANESDVLDYMYNELNEGHPVVLQVSQRYSNEGLRHLVTTVGYDSSVKSASDLNPDTILVLDCVDGKIQTLGQARSEGGHERRLFAQGGQFQALGPTDKFLNSIA